MAITFRGTASAWTARGNNATVQNLFAIVNHKYSRVNVLVKQLEIMNDAVSTQTVVCPVVRVSRITTAVTGGSLVPKVPFDTAQSSSDKVRIFAQVDTSSIITATASNASWQTYPSRAVSAAEQRLFMSPQQGQLMPNILSNTPNAYIIRPGQSLLVQAVSPSASSNTHDNHNYFIQVSWEEDTLPTFNISGVATLSGSPVNGAKVTVLESTTLDFDDAEVVEIKTTNALGEWSSTIVQGRYGKATAQYRVGTTYYTSISRPYLGA